MKRARPAGLGEIHFEVGDRVRLGGAVFVVRMETATQVLVHHEQSGSDEWVPKKSGRLTLHRGSASVPSAPRAHQPKSSAPSEPEANGNDTDVEEDDEQLDDDLLRRGEAIAKDIVANTKAFGRRKVEKQNLETEALEAKKPVGYIRPPG